ncbi:MAG: hypothetical protein AUG49_23615 [Catenulispora sp. 13_1_20CM_3_70_7]|nr:MAG: hypothetical protein AUG49_23615 [Catenulispora sp. 13_1_20CM_3_70_7]
MFRALAVVASLLLPTPADGPVANAAAQPGPYAVPSTVYTGPGFDACAAPSSSTMDAWLHSPYRGIGIYLGGRRYAVGCRDQNAQNLTPDWARHQAANGWRFLPLYVGSQAQYRDHAGHAHSDFDALSADTAYQLGSSEARDAAALAATLGFGPRSVVYNDMESYPSAYRSRVLAYSRGWTAELHREGYRSGWYSSSSSGTKDQADAYGPDSPDVLDIAAWNGSNNTDDPNVPASQWANHQRVHQNAGTHDETYGGVTLSIDIDWFDVGDADRATIERLGGIDRDATAILASARTYTCVGCTTPDRDHARAAVLSHNDGFADALAGSALAAQVNGPLLLTPPSILDPAATRELRRILPPGSTVYLVGGTAVLSGGVEAALRAAGFDPVRIAGADRFGTAVSVARTISPAGPPSAVLVATGSDFPDALVAGAAAGAIGIGAQHAAAVLLSEGATMPASTRAYLAAVDPSATKVYGVGGNAVTALRTAFPGWAGNVTALVGPDRDATAVAVAQRFFPQPTSAVIASDANWPDALAGGPMAAHRGAPLLLTGPNVLRQPTADYLRAKNNPITEAIVMGGTAAISAYSVRQLGDALSYPGQWDLAVARP